MESGEAGKVDHMANTPANPSADPAYRHVLVPLDGSDLAAGAVGTARALAERLGADLTAVSAASGPEDVAAMRAHAAEVLGSGPDDPRIEVVTSDEPDEVIAQRAADLGACLVCMSTHGRGRVAGAVMGSVARRVVERMGEPVVAVGPLVGRPTEAREAPLPFSSDHIVACVDGGAPSELVLPVAAAWAKRLGTALTILTVAEPSPPPVRPGATWHRRHGPNADADDYLAELAEAWRAQVPELRTQVVYDPIGPADGLRSYLRDHPTDLLAVTSHARSGLQRLVLGSGAASIIAASTAPVLVVPLGG